MSKKIISTICILAVLNFIGCSSKEVITKDTFIQTYKSSNDEDKKDIYIHTINDEQYFFSYDNYFFENDSLNGIGKKILLNNKEDFKGKIALAAISNVELEDINPVTTLLLVIGITSIIIGAAFLADLLYQLGHMGGFGNL